ncbi:hypothetical protein FRC11_006110 [Ceratobasidium sp. 423]|nr:hypothetical protein FRC11_006110 [Ceratobasidium sp. 423]
MIPERVMTLARQEARKSKKGISAVLGLDRVVCHCARCKGKKSHLPAVVEKHMLLYPPVDSNGESAPQADPSNSQPPALPPGPEPSFMDVDHISRAATPAMSDHSMDLQDNLGLAQDECVEDTDMVHLIRAPQIRIYKSRASEVALEKPFNCPTLDHSREACTITLPDPETMIDESLLDNWPDPPNFRLTSPIPFDYDPTSTPLPATPLCNTPKPEGLAQDADPEENRWFFANLLHAGDDEDFDFDFGGEQEDFGDGQEDFEDGQEDMGMGEAGDEGLDEDIEGYGREE